MLLSVYTIYDKKASECSQLFYAQNLAVAQRHFDNIMRENPFLDDYQLKLVGSIDTQTCIFEPAIEV
ncbi:MAG: hypothetical protein FWH53_00545 [Leptospirales bacterium]|nr:hypothetical protein [Leptospirales bacterium]